MHPVADSILVARRNVELSLLIISVAVTAGALWLTSLAGTAGVPRNFAVQMGIFTAAASCTHLLMRRVAPRADPIFVPTAFLLSGCGLAFIARLQDNVESAGGLASAQTRWLILAVLAFAATLVTVRRPGDLARYRYTWAAGGIVLLLLPLVPGIGREINGAQLWIRLGPLQFQPGELAKIALALFLAGYLAERKEVLSAMTRRLGPLSFPDLRHFGPLMLAWGISLIVMIMQKDLGSSLLFFALFVVILWVTTGRGIYLLSGTLLFLVGAAGVARSFEHVGSRISVWIDPWRYLDSSGYQLSQSLFAFATGGAWGTGLGLGYPQLIPSVSTDFIFAAIGEELGLAGTVALLLAYALFVSRGIRLALISRDDFTKLLACGLTFVFGLQTFIIIGGVTRLIPLTGITLPFVSYGGSSLVANFILVALLVRLSHEAAEQPREAPPREVGPREVRPREVRAREIGT